MKSEYNCQIKEMLIKAVESAFISLFKEFPGHYYYCAVIMSENAPPFISAWSEEAFAGFCKTKRDLCDKYEYRYSYADSPYCGYGYDKFFGEINAFFEEIIDKIDLDDEYSKMINLWAESMTEVMAELDKKGLFGVSEEREDVLINVEIIPSSVSVLETAKRLNPYISYEKYREYYTKIDHSTEEIDYHSIYHPETCDVYVKRPIIDKKKLLLVKKMFYYDGTIKNLISICSASNNLIRKNVDRNLAEEFIKNNPIFYKFLKIVKN